MAKLAIVVKPNLEDTCVTSWQEPHVAYHGSSDEGEMVRASRHLSYDLDLVRNKCIMCVLVIKYDAFVRTLLSRCSQTYKACVAQSPAPATPRVSIHAVRFISTA